MTNRRPRKRFAIVATILACGVLAWARYGLPARLMTFAIIEGDLNSAKRAVLIRQSVVHERDGWQDSCLARAVDFHRTEIVELLLANGADPNVYGVRLGIPLGIAAKDGRSDLVELLIEGGADVSIRADHFLTPIHYAAMGGDPECIRLLVQHGANVNERSTGDSMWTPLHYAVWPYPVRPNRADAITLLIQLGADLDSVNSEGESARDLALIYANECRSNCELAVAIAELVRRDRTPDNVGVDSATNV
jgi:hypothetical protein